MELQTRRRVTLAEAMGDSSLDDRAELILGEVWQPEVESKRHFLSCVRLERVLVQKFPEQAVFRDAPLEIPEDGRPRPDCVVLRSSAESYLTAMDFDADDAVLVAGVCLTSERRDRIEKDIQYAKGNIPEYWILDLDEGYLERRTEPGNRGYTRREVLLAGDEILGIPVSELLQAEP